MTTTWHEEPSLAETLNPPPPGTDPDYERRLANRAERLRSEAEAIEQPILEDAEKYEPPPGLIELSMALDDLVRLLTRYIEFVTTEQSDALALWIAYTHWFAHEQPFSFVPYMLVTSAERQSGKSTVLELSAMLVHEPLDGQDMSAALVGRRCGGRTLLLDEIDGVYSARDSGDDSGATDLRTILNAGFKYDGKYQRLDRKSMEPVEWSVYGPKMLVGIGRNVPDTVADRSIAVRMVRKSFASKLPKLRARIVKPTADKLKARLANLAARVPLGFVDDMPDELDGRRQDIWEPLFALARVASGEWLARVEKASVELTKSEPNVTLGVQLLSDIRDLFEQRGDPEMIATADMIGRPEDRREVTDATGLCAFEESPWATFTRGRPITPHKVSVLLGEFDIRPERQNIGRHSYGPKGYWRVRFEKAWERYLGDPTDTSDTFAQRTETSGGNGAAEREHGNSSFYVLESDVSYLSADSFDPELATDDDGEVAP